MSCWNDPQQIKCKLRESSLGRKGLEVSLESWNKMLFNLWVRSRQEKKGVEGTNKSDMLWEFNVCLQSAVTWGKYSSKV